VGPSRRVALFVARRGSTSSVQPAPRFFRRCGHARPTQRRMILYSAEYFSRRQSNTTQPDPQGNRSDDYPERALKTGIGPCGAREYYSCIQLIRKFGSASPFRSALRCARKCLREAAFWDCGCGIACECHTSSACKTDEGGECRRSSAIAQSPHLRTKAPPACCGVAFSELAWGSWILA